MLRGCVLEQQIWDNAVIVDVIFCWFKYRPNIVRDLLPRSCEKSFLIF
jgi:hypothetical protein